MSRESDTEGRRQGPGFVQVGIGMHCTFMCSGCNKPKSTLGRRLKFNRHKGLRLFICAQCVESRERQAKAEEAAAVQASWAALLDRSNL